MARFIFAILALVSVSVFAACTNTDDVMHGNAPILSALTATTGPAFGGNQVTLTGVGFNEAPPLVVRFGANDATGITILSNTEVRVTVPAGTPSGVVNVSLSNGNGESILTAAYTYSSIALASISPNLGPSAGGTSVTLTGVGFDNGAPSVTFGGVAALNVALVSDTEVTCDTPAGTSGSTVAVAITNTGGTATLANAFAYDPFLVNSLLPPNGPGVGGTTVTVSGVGFNAAVPTVTFGPNMGTNVTVVNDGMLTVDTPVGTPGATVDVRVTSTAGDATLPQSFTYDPFLVFSVVTNNGPAIGGTSVTLNGVGFSYGATSVAFGANPATNVIVISDGSLTCDVPAGVANTMVGVSVTNSLGTATLPNGYHYDDFALTMVTPANGQVAGGATISLTGTGFSTGGAVTVEVGGIAATNVAVINDTTVWAETPVGMVGQVVSVRIMNGNGDVTLAGAYTYDALNLTGLDLTMGPAAGGNTITLVGTGLDSGAVTVTFGNNPATNVVVLSDDGVSCDVPAGVIGTTVDVWLDNGNGTAVLYMSYTYQ